MVLALHRTLRKYGYPAQDIHARVVALYKGTLESETKAVRSLMRWLSFSGLFRNRMRKWAEISQKRQYPDSWVFSYVPGDGRTFAYGLDVTECAICKFYRAQGEQALLPFLCQLDFVQDEVIHLGLIRSETLGEGASRCDFRFRK